ncbi:MAG: hypothetical protein NDJ72_09510 [Elusimicrobia bacterium]|nr:hypothetical protein [Elusimicrobiota bacterium]
MSKPLDYAAAEPLLPALRMMVRFPTRPTKVVSFETGIELAALDRYVRAYGRPTKLGLEQLERHQAGRQPSKSAPRDARILAAATPVRPAPPAPPAPACAAPSAGQPPVADSARNSAPPAPPAPAAPAPQVPRPPPLGPDLGRWLEAQRVEIRGRVTCFQVAVGPPLASAWLQLNHGNRRPSRAKIRRFAAAMAAGKWSLNGETVKFSATGRLLDGQSRLEAIVQARVPVVLEVRAGLPDLAQQSMDTGELRRGTHTLEMLGEGYPAILAPALKLVFLWQKGWLGGAPFGSSRILENSEIAPLLGSCPALRASVGWTVSAGAKVTRYLLHSEAAFFHWLFGTIDPQKRDTFFAGVIHGLGLTKDNPAYHLRERLVDLRQGEDTGPRKATRRALAIKAWNCAWADLPCASLRHAADDPFPAVHGIANPERQPGGFKRPRQLARTAGGAA